MKIVCFGSGLRAKEFLENDCKYGNIEIEYFLDNRETSSTRYGYECYLPSVENCKDKFIVVTCGDKYYQAIKEQLCGYGLRENVNFINVEKFVFDLKNSMNGDKPELVLWFEDFWQGFNPYKNYFMEIIQKYFRVKLDDKNPDYIICSMFGGKTLEYEGVRIVYTGENVVPDFNVYDYVIGFEHIQYDDRYLRWPLYKLYVTYKDAQIKHSLYEAKEWMEREFCCRVVSNGTSADSFREELFDAMNSIKPVASGGRYKNNLPGGKPVADKNEFLKKYRFNLAIENSLSYSGYTTEKIIDAWAAGCIPIYWGNKKIAEEFSEDAFVNCHKFDSIEDIVSHVIELNEDPEKLQKMLKVSIFKDESKVDIDNFFKNIFCQKKADAYRRLERFSSWGKKIEKLYRTEGNVE